MVVVRVEGDVDVGNTLALRETLSSALGDGRERVLLDLQQVEFIDSAGVGLLVTGQRRAAAAGGALALAAVTPSLQSGRRSSRFTWSLAAAPRSTRAA